VIDVGSAITIDLVTDRVFQGGLIIAGPDLSVGSLASGTANLPRLAFSNGPGQSWPTRSISTTAGAMIAGAGIQAAGAIKEAVHYLEGKAGRKLPRIVTGGGFPAISHCFPGHRWPYDPNLLMRGLYRIWELNCPDYDM
jgi:type III pantothenate kinase